MKKLTVFTPTYNRAYCLINLYKSLCVQTVNDFIWLIVDDGSTDNTKELVEQWMHESQIEINYIFKTNGGMHTGHNTAYQNIKTPLNVCIDSDDTMPPDAVALILEVWQKMDQKKYAGMIGLDAFKNGAIIGDPFPEKLETCRVNDLYLKLKLTGDKKIVYRTDVVQRYPLYPEFSEERLVPLGTLYLQIDQDYELVTINKSLCVVEYLEDGSSRNIFKQYKRNPKGFFYSRLVELQYGTTFRYKFTRAMHLVSSALFGRISVFKNNPEKIITFLALPFGLLLHVYIVFKIAYENPSNHQ
ncbi:MAG: hypothetical protein RL607_524 [Bacteroidota bacterium]|jgi:glycosyltransferase involved in cell wall biosynthesis